MNETPLQERIERVVTNGRGYADERGYCDGLGTNHNGYIHGDSAPIFYEEPGKRVNHALMCMALGNKPGDYRLPEAFRPIGLGGLAGNEFELFKRFYVDGDPFTRSCLISSFRNRARGR